MTLAHGLTRYKRGPDEDGTPGEGCRCAECTGAILAYDRHRDRMIAYGRWQPFVPAARARAHAAWLRSCGLGPDQIGRLAGIAGPTVAALLDGRPGSPPTRKVRPETEAAILAVRPRLDLMSRGTLVDSAGTRRRTHALARLGWPVITQGRMAGVGHLGEAIRQDHVSAACARKMRDLYDRLWNQPPPAGTVEQRRVASLVRGIACRNGWPLAGAWDDEPGPHYIDDPAAVPAPGWDRAGDAAAAAIRRARENKKMTRLSLAAVLGVSASTVKAWEDAERKPDAGRWVQLELTLGPLGIVRTPEPEQEAPEKAA